VKHSDDAYAAFAGVGDGVKHGGLNILPTAAFVWLGANWGGVV